MSGPSIDLEERNPLGALDRLATGLGLAVLAVFPTLLATICMPWKLGPLIISDEPDGRRGMILSPGTYFVFSLVVILVIIGSLATPEVAEADGGLIGSGLALDVTRAAREGDVWKTLSEMTPLFIMTLIFGTLGRVLTRWVGPWWDIRASLRTSFYAVSTVINWVLIATFLAERFNTPPIAHDLTGFAAIAILLWIFFWSFRSGGHLTFIRSGVLTMGLAFLVLMFVASFGIIVSLA